MRRVLIMAPLALLAATLLLVSTSGAAASAATSSSAAVAPRDLALTTVFDAIQHVTRAASPSPAAHASSSSSPFHVLSLGGPGSDEPFELTPSQAASVRASFGTSSAGLAMRDRSPRFGSKDPDMEHIDTSNKWLMGLAIAFAIGAGIAIVQLLATGIYMFIRCCCWRWLMKRRSDWEKPEFTGYKTWWAKYWPVVFLCFFMSISVAFAAVGIAYNDGLSRSFSTSNTEYGIGPLILAPMETLYDWSGQIMDVFNDLLTGPNSGVQHINEQLQTLLPPSIMSDSQALRDQINGFGSRYGPDLKFTDTASGQEYACGDACAALQSSSSAVVSGLDSGLLPTLREFDQVVRDVQSEFMAQVDDISAEVNSALEGLDSARGDIIGKSMQADIRDYSKEVEKGDKYRNAGFITLFSLSFVAPVLVAIGLLTKRAFPFKLTFCLGPFYLFLIWLLFGLHWSVGLFIGDGCSYVDESIVKLPSVLGSDQGNLASVANACLTNSSLLTALNLEDKLNFTNLLHFPAPLSTAEVNAKFALPGLDALSAQTQPSRLNLTSFGFDNQTLVADRLADMNNVRRTDTTYGSFTEADVSSCHSQLATCYDAYYSGQDLTDIRALQEAVWNSLQVRAQIEDTLTQIRADSTGVLTSVTALKTQFVSLVSSVSNIERIMEPVFDAIDRFRSLAYCYDLSLDFRNFKHTFCDNLGESIGWITFALFMVGLSCLPITWTARWASYRVAFVPRVAPMDGANWMYNAGYADPAWNIPGPNAADPMQQAQMQQGMAPQVQLAQMPADDGTMGESQPQFAANDTALAVGAPSYADAMAHYNSNGDAATAQPDQLASPSGAAADEDASNRSPCESCEQAPAAVRCEDCEEDLCRACDEALHTREDKHQHRRAFI